MSYGEDQGGAVEPRRAVKMEILTPPPGADAVLIAPRPFPHWGQRFDRLDVTGVASFSEIGAANSRCRAYLLSPDGDAPINLRYEFGYEDHAAPDWVWEVQRNRLTKAAPSLVQHVQEICREESSQSAQLQRLIDDAASIFGYAHVDDPFNAGHDDVPMICGTTKGSCVEINTYLLAGALSLGISGQYVIGYWFHPEKTETPDAHCWLAFNPNDRAEPVFWDLAHCIKWGPTLGATIGEGLNPAGGRRLGMSCGRGLAFATPQGRIEISHFAEPYWLTAGADGVAVATRPEMRFSVEDPDGDRSHFPAALAAARTAAE